MRGAPTAIFITLFLAGGILGGGMMTRAGHGETAPGGFDASEDPSRVESHDLHQTK